MVHGARSMVFDVAWRRAHVAWRMAHGAWRMKHAAWRMGHGRRRMAHGAWRELRTMRIANVAHRFGSLRSPHARTVRIANIAHRFGSLRSPHARTMRVANAAHRFGSPRFTILVERFDKPRLSMIAHTPQSPLPFPRAPLLPRPPLPTPPSSSPLLPPLLSHPSSPPSSPPSLPLFPLSPSSSPPPLPSCNKRERIQIVAENYAKPGRPIGTRFQGFPRKNPEKAKLGNCTCTGFDF